MKILKLVKRFNNLLRITKEKIFLLNLSIPNKEKEKMVFPLGLKILEIVNYLKIIIKFFNSFNHIWIFNEKAKIFINFFLKIIICFSLLFQFFTINVFYELKIC